MDSITLAQRNNFFKRHKWALVASFIVGLIALAPHIIFPLQFGKEYKGIYMMQTANETEYLARIKEITDGHWKLGSVPFYEYKNNPPLMPPNALDFLYAGANFITGISISNLVIVSKFFLPALFFLLIYFLIRQLTRNKEFLSNKINAVGSGFLIVLGYDLVDYGSLISYIRGASSPNDFLLWTRPINPIFGGISLLSKNWLLLKRICLTTFLGILFSTPYLYNIYMATKNSIYKESAVRTGIFYGRELMLNKFLILALAVFVAASFVVFIKNKKKKSFNFWGEKWWFVCLAMIVCGFIAFNQQLITGQTVWPYHFVQYTIPLSVTALFITLYNFSFFSYGFRRVCVTIVFISIASSLSFGVYTQSIAYKNNFESYREKQKYAEVFDWLNNNAKKDCVVLTEDKIFFNKAITIYTDCDVYLSDFNSFMVPNERLYNNYMVFLKLQGVNESSIEEYVKKNTQDVAVHFYGAEGLVYGSTSPSFLVIKDKFINDYKKFLSEDFMDKIKKYKVDYFIVELKNKNGDFSQLTGVFSSENFLIFQ